MKVADLKRELKARGLTTSGNKNELIERLQLAEMENNQEEEVQTTQTKVTQEVEKSTPAVAAPAAPVALKRNAVQQR